MLWFVLSGCVGSQTLPGTLDTGSPDPGTPTVTSPSPMPTQVTSPCAVIARDGTERTCSDPVVRCDPTVDGLAIRDECCECDPDTCGWLPDMECWDVEVPPRPETCSPHTVGTPESVELTENIWQIDTDLDGVIDTECRLFPNTFGVFTDEASFLQSVECVDDIGQQVPPPEGWMPIDFATGELHALGGTDGFEVLGLYGDTMVINTGCPSAGGPPPPPYEIRVVLPPGSSVVGCHAQACPVYLGPPLP